MNKIGTYFSFSSDPDGTDTIFSFPRNLSEPVCIAFDGPLVGKERARNAGHFYAPNRSRETELAIGYEARKSMRGKVIFDGLVFARICIFRKVPKSWTRAKTEAALRGYLMPITKPDIDNQVKTIFDSLNKIVYRDDSQIVGKKVIRRYAEKEGFVAEFRQLVVSDVMPAHDTPSRF